MQFADKEKAGSSDFERWTAAAFLTQRAAAERQTNHEVQCSILQRQWKPFCATIVHIGTSNQPLRCLQCPAAETVKASLISGHAAEGSLHWGLKAGLGLVTPSVRQTNQAISRCCVVDRETLS